MNIDSNTQRERRPRKVRWRALLAILAILVVAAIAAVLVAVLTDVFGGGGGKGTLTRPGGEPITLEYPSDWQPLNQDQLSAFGTAPLAALRQKDGKGTVVVRRDKPFSGNLKKFATDLRTALDKQLPDFKEVSARIVNVASGNAFYYSYVRTSRGTVHTIVIVPAGTRSYVLDTVTTGGADDVARELASIITSFTVEKS
jgi:hypothetical protein